MLEGMFEDVHSQRLDALANYAEATMRAMRAGVHAIGAAYAELAEIKPKHANRQPHGSTLRAFRQPHGSTDSPGSWSHPRGG